MMNHDGRKGGAPLNVAPGEGAGKQASFAGQDVRVWLRATIVDVDRDLDGRLLSLQLVELISGVDIDRELVVRDYLPSGRRSRTVERALTDLDGLSDVDLLDLAVVAKALGFTGASDDLDLTVSPRGYRLLARVPRLPATVVDRLVESFGGLQRLLAASIDDLQTVEGVGETRARTVREGLSRLAESSILERYV